MSVNAADLGAAIDLVGEAIEDSDSYDFEEAVAMRDALILLRARAAVAMDLIESEMARQLEGGERQWNGMTYKAVNKYRTRADHDAIEGHVLTVAKDVALDRQTGEIDLDEAVRQAAHLMRQVYVSPSTPAKSGALKSLGLDPWSVVSRERTGRGVAVSDP